MTTGACPRFQEVLAWTYDHGQSLEWLWYGDLVGMICRDASHSPIATALPDPALAAAERFRATHEAVEAFGDEEPDDIHCPAHAEWEAKSDAAADAEWAELKALSKTRPTTKAGAQALIAAHLMADPNEDIDRSLLDMLAEAIPHLV
jgi:hypothetical protein